MFVSMRSPALSLLASLGLLLPAAAQEDLKQAQNKGGKQIQAAEAEAGDDGSDGNIVGKGEMAPKQVNIVHGARGHCRFDLAADPARLAPGQSGLLKLTMVLEGDAVLLAPANLQPSFAPNQGPLTLGSFSVRPATTAKVAAAYRGQQVYDNYAIVEIPVTMAPTAQMGGKFPVSVAFQFELYHGTQAVPLGNFTDSARTEIECGIAPNPNVVIPVGGTDRPAPAAAEPAAAVPAEAGKAGDGAGPASAKGATIEAASTGLEARGPAGAGPKAGDVRPAGDAPEGVDEAGPRVDVGGNSLLLYVGGAGVLLLLVSVLLLRRR